MARRVKSDAHSPFGQLLRLFDAVAGEMPELPQVRVSVEIVDRLRTTCLPRSVTRWPVELKQLPGIADDCRRLIARLQKADTAAGSSRCHGSGVPIDHIEEST